MFIKIDLLATYFRDNSPYGVFGKSAVSVITGVLAVSKVSVPKDAVFERWIALTQGVTTRASAKEGRNVNIMATRSPAPAYRARLSNVRRSNLRCAGVDVHFPVGNSVALRNSYQLRYQCGV